MKKIFNLIEQDLGRPLSDLTSELVYEDLVKDMKEVLRTLVFIEKQVSVRNQVCGIRSGSCHTEPQMIKLTDLC